MPVKEIDKDTDIVYMPWKWETIVGIFDARPRCSKEAIYIF